MLPALKGRIYTVTGAASGIGRATAVKLARLGASGIALSDVNEHGLRETKALCRFRFIGSWLLRRIANAECKGAKYDTKITTANVDVSKYESVNAWIDNVLKDFGRLDGCANVAGVAGGDGDTTIETIVSPSFFRSFQTRRVIMLKETKKQDDWDRMMGINLNGVMHCMRAQLPQLSKPGGSIVNVASTAGIHGLPKSSAYSASKHGVIGLTASAAGEYGRAGVRINALLPYVHIVPRTETTAYSYFRPMF